jgi:hypothetical protein
MTLPSREQLKKAKQNNVWDFGNKILYDMCREYFHHNKAEHILTKVLFIGRIYASAVERRRNKKDEINDNFYIDTIAPTFINSKLDTYLDKLKSIKNLNIGNIKEILQTHYYLTNTLKKITDLEKRSFSSKYLHFHLPDLFFIYDSRAVMALRFFTSNVPKDLKKFIQLETADIEYAKFYCKCFDLKRQIEVHYKKTMTMRQFDNLLIEIANNKNNT